MSKVRFLLPTLLVVACEPLPPEKWENWYDAGGELDVMEPVAFTDQNYDAPPADVTPIGDFLDNAFDMPRGFGTNYATEIFGDSLASCDNFFTTTNLPATIEGIATILPRKYYKARGCTTDAEKYYGSYFIQDATGGIFVLGDSKVAHFDNGDRVRIKVNSTRISFDQPMVYAHEIVSIERSAEPIYYETLTGPAGFNDLNEVRRVTGTVVVGPDNFGEFLLKPDGWNNNCSDVSTSQCVPVSLDVELTRRGITVDAGERVTVTAPVYYSFSSFTFVVMRLGQLERLND